MKSVERFVNNTMVKYSHLYDQEVLLQTMYDQMTDYRLTFPMLISNGKYIHMIVLLAPSADPRTISLLQHMKLTLRTDADLVFLCYGYENSDNWESQARRLIKIFPEQRYAPEGVIMR